MAKPDDSPNMDHILSLSMKEFLKCYDLNVEISQVLEGLFVSSVEQLLKNYYDDDIKENLENNQRITSSDAARFDQVIIRLMPHYSEYKLSSITMTNNSNANETDERAPANKWSEQNANKFTNISKQIGGTCYAHAVAHALRETENRIVGRNPPSHDDYVKEIVSKYGTDGGSTAKVLKWQCTKRHLRYSHVNVKNAKTAIKNGRVIVGTFSLNTGQWHKLSQFFGDDSTRDYVYEKCDIGEGYSGNDDGGHAVAIVGYGNDTTSETTGKPVEYWKIKNSWGTQFADKGFFRFSLDMPLTYYDVYYVVNDLTRDDRDNFRKWQRKNNAECNIENKDCCLL